jgi:hypothetical protein
MQSSLAVALAAVFTTVALAVPQQKPTPPDPAQAPAKPPTTAATSHADSDKSIQGSGELPAGWNVRFDKPDAKKEMVKVVAEKDALEFETGPAGIYYRTDMKAEKDYEVGASFSQLDPAKLPEEFGLIIGGVDLDKPTQQYTCFLVRQDAKFSIQKRNGTTTKAAVAWRPVPAMKEPKGVKTTHTLIIRAHGNDVRFFIGDKEVAKLTRAQVGGDGLAGLRINHNLHLQVSKFEIKKLP